MLNRTQAKEILQILQSLPTDKFAEAYDYLIFLRDKYASPRSVDVSDVWDDEDTNDLMVASLAYAERAIGEANI